MAGYRWALPRISSFHWLIGPIRHFSHHMLSWPRARTIGDAIRSCAACYKIGLLQRKRHSAPPRDTGSCVNATSVRDEGCILKFLSQVDKAHFIRPTIAITSSALEVLDVDCAIQIYLPTYLLSYLLTYLTTVMKEHITVLSQIKPNRI